MKKIYIGELVGRIKAASHDVLNLVHFSEGTELEKYLEAGNISYKIFNPKEEICSKKEYIDDFLYSGFNGSNKRELFLDFDRINIDFDFFEKYAYAMLDVLDSVWGRRGLAGLEHFVKDYPDFFKEKNYLERVLEYVVHLNSKGSQRRTFGIPKEEILLNVPFNRTPFSCQLH
jgi:hypothetical protein